MGSQLLSVFLFLTFVSYIHAAVYANGWKAPRFPEDRGEFCEGTCICDADLGVCNIKCPGEEIPPEAPQACDPTGSSSIIVQSAKSACSAVLTSFSGGGANNGLPLKIAGQFTTLGTGSLCYTLRLGDSVNRQQVEFELWPYVSNVIGFYDFTIYEKGLGTYDTLPSGSNLYTASTLGGSPPEDDHTPEAYAISVGFGFHGETLRWSGWRFQATNILTKANGVSPILTRNLSTTAFESTTDTYMTAFDFDTFGAGAGDIVSAIRITNLQPADLVWGGSDGTSGWVSFGGDDCDQHDCHPPQYLRNGTATNYSTNSYDPDIFWISEITDTSRDFIVAATTGTTGSTGSTGSTGTTDIPTTGSTGSTGTTASTGSTGTTASTGSTGTTDFQSTTATTTTDTTTTTTTETTTTTTGGETTTTTTGGETTTTTTGGETTTTTTGGETTTTTTGSTGTTGVQTTGSTGTTGLPTSTRAVLTSVDVAYGNNASLSPDGLRVNGYNFVDNPNIRCLFGTLLQTRVLTFTPTAVWCALPTDSQIPQHSRFPAAVQVLNDFSFPSGVSNSLPFALIAGALPTIVGTSFSTSDRYCAASATCERLEVWGTGLTPASRIDCVWSAVNSTGQTVAYTKPGRLSGFRRVGANTYTQVVCDQSPIFPLRMTGPTAATFSLLVYRSSAATVLTPSSLATNQVPWTFTCDPCDV